MPSPGVQGHAFEILHRDEARPVGLTNLVNRADVWMVERRSGAGLPAEALKRRRVFGNIVGKKLQSHEAAEREVFGFVHHTHPSAAKLLDDTVVRDGLINHADLSGNEGILGGEVGEVKEGRDKSVAA